MYQMRMFGYYPKVIQSILEFKAIIDGEYPEFDMLAEGRDRTINDAYYLTMTEERTKEWEQALGVTPIPDSSLSDRRETIAARIRGQGKLNSELINSIVNTFTGGTANSWIKDNVLYVEITPPPGNKQFQFDNVEQELSLKVPTSLGLAVSRNYFTWSDIKKDFSTWQDVKDNFDTWYDVKIYVPFE